VVCGFLSFALNNYDRPYLDDPHTLLWILASTQPFPYQSIALCSNIVLFSLAYDRYDSVWIDEVGRELELAVEPRTGGIRGKGLGDPSVEGDLKGTAVGEGLPDVCDSVLTSLRGDGSQVTGDGLAKSLVVVNS